MSAGRSLLDAVVVHRGLHDVDDLPIRPLENTLQAFQQCWKDFSLAECDIVCSRDGQLYLCHDRTFARLAEDFTSPLANRDVCELSSWEIDQIKLKDGTFPSPLERVLECARDIAAKDKQLVVEIKAGDSNTPLLLSALKELLVERAADLAQHVAVIMSFDAQVMRDLAEWKKTTTSHIQLMLLLKNTDVLRLHDEHSANEDDVVTALVGQVGELDGAYLQVHEDMLSPGHWQRRVVHQLCQHVRAVGVWNASKSQPQFDGLKLETAGSASSSLTALGVRYVNSDLPQEELILLGLVHYREKSARDMSSSQWFLSDLCCW